MKTVTEVEAAYQRLLQQMREGRMPPTDEVNRALRDAGRDLSDLTRELTHGRNAKPADGDDLAAAAATA